MHPQIVLSDNFLTVYLRGNSSLQNLVRKPDNLHAAGLKGLKSISSSLLVRPIFDLTLGLFLMGGYYSPTVLWQYSLKNKVWNIILSIMRVALDVSK